MNEKTLELVAKVPQVTLVFWIIKILATTLGETAGDAVTMSWLGETTAEAKGTGYLIGTGIFGVIFIVAVLVQIRAKKFHPFLYWLTASNPAQTFSSRLRIGGMRIRRAYNFAQQHERRIGEFVFFHD